MPRTKPNLFDPVLSADAYTGQLKENERTVALQPRLAASDADSGNTVNGLLVFARCFAICFRWGFFIDLR